MISGEKLWNSGFARVQMNEYAKRNIPRRTRNDDEVEDEQSTNLPPIRVLTQRTIATEYHIAIGDIGIEEDQGFADVVNVLRNVSEYDVIKMFITSGGGSVFSAMRIFNAMRSTDATIVTIGDSYVASAATFLLLIGDVIDIRDHCSMLIHDISTQVEGKFSDITRAQTDNEKMKQKLFSDVYAGFLSEEELVDLARGMDFRFDAPEIRTRILKMQKYRNEKREAELAKASAFPPDVAAPGLKKRRKKKSKKV